MKTDIRPSKPNYGSGYDIKRGDKYGQRDGHGGYQPDAPTANAGEGAGYNQAHGQGKQLERSNPKTGKRTSRQNARIKP